MSWVRIPLGALNFSSICSVYTQIGISELTSLMMISFLGSYCCNSFALTAGIKELYCLLYFTTFFLSDTCFVLVVTLHFAEWKHCYNAALIFSFWPSTFKVRTFLSLFRACIAIYFF